MRSEKLNVPLNALDEMLILPPALFISDNSCEYRACWAPDHR